MSRLTKTSYGILGMLAMRPWSAYELSNEVRRWLSDCMGPRAETSLYQEPKNLVAHGLARAKVVAFGGRTRTVYSITPAGRRALRKWLGQPSAPPVFESEAVVRLLFSEYGSRKALLATLTQLEQHVAEMRQRVAMELGEVVDKIGMTPERLYSLPLGGKLYFDYFELLAAWARWARAEVENWPDEWPREVTPEQVEAFRAAVAQGGQAGASRRDWPGDSRYR